MTTVLLARADPLCSALGLVEGFALDNVPRERVERGSLGPYVDKDENLSGGEDICGFMMGV